MVERVAAEVFPPGEFIKEELEARGWTQTDLAEILGRPFQLVNAILAGKRAISPETAQGLGEAFGTGAQVWMNLENTYRLSRTKPRDDSVVRRARLFETAPIKEMIRRHWIEPSESIDVLEKQVCAFYHISDLDQEPTLWPHAARKPVAQEDATPTQIAWLFRVRQLAEALEAPAFSQASLKTCLEKLDAIKHEEEEARSAPRILMEAGIRFVVVEPLPKTRIDGMCLWLDKHSPVVALSFRYDRIDWFWFTLMHELWHVKNRDGLEKPGIIDVNLVGQGALSTDQKPESERLADSFAADFLVSQEAIESFIIRKGPVFSKQKIRGFALLHKVHPGVVAGQLQRRGEMKFSHNREMLVKVRQIVTRSALTDGWGNSIAVRV